jgi:RNA polymerase sigma-70 factor (ECF subfamily)
VTTRGRRPSQTGGFETTSWAVIAQAADRTSPRRQQALAELCQAYWYPLYAFIRRRGYAPEAAEDLTQGFFADLLSRDALEMADPALGRFRSFLIAALKHYLANSRIWEHRLKRGGWGLTLSLDFRDAEGCFVREPAHDLTPERLFERRWAQTLLRHTLERLERETAVQGKHALFQWLKPALSGESAEVSYAQISAALGMAQATVRVAAHRLRRRFGALIREEIARTVTAPDHVEEEIQELFQALRLDQ